MRDRNTSNTIVVTGATGNVGRALTQALAHAGVDVRGVSRRPPEHRIAAQHVAADLSEPQTLRAAVAGAQAMFVLLAGSGEGIDPGAVLDVARAGGVERVVLLSSQGADTRPNGAAHRHLRRFEEILKRSPLQWTVLRPGGFDSNTVMWAPMVRTQRTVIAPFGDVAIPLVDPADVAEVAAVALRNGAHHQRTYVLTGPAPISPRQQAQAIGEALGTPIAFIEQSRDEARAQMLQFMPQEVVDGTLSILGDPVPSEQQVSGDIERLLGRTPRSFADWARRNRELFK